LLTENNNLEFKRELTDSIVKEIIAFCNTTGGTIILGYDDNGKIVGLENAKEDLDRLSSKINDSIEPSVNFLVSNRINILDEMLEKEIIKKTGFSKNVVYKLK
jgi:ATP-dependent DNA helicase RecG